MNTFRIALANIRFPATPEEEGWRYPETVRWAVRHGAHIVFHPHFHEAEPGGYEPSSFADPANSFDEKAMLCRAAENTCYRVRVSPPLQATRQRRRQLSFDAVASRPAGLNSMASIDRSSSRIASI